MPAEPTTATEVIRARPVSPVATIRFTTGAIAGTAIRLVDDDSTLGRSEANGYVVADPRVSRVHARLVRRAGTVIVTDLGSSGGTTVNGTEIDGRHRLRHGDTISFSGVGCHFEDPVASAEDERATQVFELPTVETGPALSPRQQQVLEHIAEGMTNGEIGDRLGIAERTVKSYAGELYDKLDVRNRAGAVAQGVKHGLL